MTIEIDELFSAIRESDIRKIYFAPNMVPILLGGYGAEEANEIIYKKLIEYFDCVVMSSDTMHLCGTEEPFIVQQTKSRSRGGFVNYVINL